MLSLIEAFNKKYTFNKTHLTITTDRFYYTIEFESDPLLNRKTFTFELDEFRSWNEQFKIKTPRSSFLMDLGLNTFLYKDKDKDKVKANDLYIDTLLNYEEADYYDILESFLEELNFTKIKEYEESKVFTLGTYEIYLLKSYVCIKLQKTENKKIETSFYRTSENKWLNQDIPTGSCTDLNLFAYIIYMIRHLWG